MRGAGAVTAGDDGATDAVIGTVARLVGSSLVRTDRRSVPARYRMLDTVREYAAERLRGGGEEDETRTRQLDYFVSLGRRVCRDEFFGPPVPEIMAALDGEHDTVRDTLERLLVARDGERAARLAGAMGTYWFERGHWGEGQRWLTRALQLTAGSRSLDRARALTALAQTTASFSGIATRTEELEEAVAIYRKEHNDGYLGAALMYLALARAWRREVPLMRTAFAEVKRIAASLKSQWIDTTIAVYDSLARVLEGDLDAAHAGLVDGAAALVDLGDESLAARALMYAGNVSRLIGDLPAARHELDQSMELARTHAIHGTHAHGMVALAQVAMDLGDADAESLFIDCLGALELIGDARCTAVCQRSLGSLALDKDHPDEALNWLQQSLQQLATHDQRALALAIADIATIRAHRGDAAAATRLAAAARSLAQQPGMPLTMTEQSRIDDAAAYANLHTSSATAPMSNGTGNLEAILELARQP